MAKRTFLEKIVNFIFKKPEPEKKNREKEEEIPSTWEQSGPGRLVE